MRSTTPTPRTDRVMKKCGNIAWVPADFARQLELERNEWRTTAVLYILCSVLAVVLLITGTGCITRRTDAGGRQWIDFPSVTVTNGGWEVGK